MSLVTFTVDHHDEFDNFHTAGSTADVSRVQAGNLVYRGMARYVTQTPDPAPASEEPAPAGDAPAKAVAKQSKGKE